MARRIRACTAYAVRVERAEHDQERNEDGEEEREGLAESALSTRRASHDPSSPTNSPPQGDQTRLTVLHKGFQPGSVVLPDISRGWPMVLSWLKTFLESGRWEEAARPAAGSRA